MLGDPGIGRHGQRTMTLLFSQGVVDIIIHISATQKSPRLSLVALGGCYIPHHLVNLSEKQNKPFTLLTNDEGCSHLGGCKVP